MPYHDLEARRRGAQILSHSQLVLRFLGRCALAAIRLPVVPLLICFAAIYLLVVSKLFLHLEGVWQPGFPTGWTAWIAFLITLPVFSAMQLAWLLASFWVRRKQEQRSKGAEYREEGYMMLNGGGSGSMASGEEGWEDRDVRGHKSRGQLWNVGTIWLIVQCVVYGYIVLAGYYSYKHYEHPGDTRFRPALRKALAERHPSPQGYARGEKVFIAAAFHQNEQVLPYWTQTMLDAITYLGTDNVFVSVVENYSSDRSPELLRDFASELDRRGVKNRILVQDETIKKPEKVEWNPRIEFLAAIRNQALEPLLAHGGYDKVLFSNDIFIEPESVIELLETRDGDFDFACGLDFGHFGAYDMWVLRDRVGHLTAGIWPYFFDTAGYEAMKKEDPVPVFTCWNGIVVFQADPVLPIHLRSNRTLSSSPLQAPPLPGHPWAKKLGPSPALTPPLVFRASVEGECYSSESFLLPYDFRRIMGLNKIYANPRVVNGYVWKYYAWHKWVLRERHVKWFIEQVWDGAWMQYARMIVGDARKVWTWDGVDCHPWW
ncbi:cryptococcal mannosyltransferase 1-domain-containing protein [Dichomitus squalens]|uniref:Cryptococcal mannosyltransferase 1-domain-containing protein n=1 Tax=Dichomitus squalens TaxID=114155 RepID=A0A4Q9MPG5_9APHY|nr:cryptococcal mannosyltransferase 1-domain-containing protein [Dichomitus squalens]